MAINIISPTQPITVNAIKVYFYGDPGMYKTTLGMTANKALIIDADKGAYRTGVNRRADVVVAECWNDIVNISPDDLEPYQTVVFDTIVLMSELFEAFIESNEEEAAENCWEKPNILFKDSEVADGYWGIGFEAEPETTSSYRSAKTHTFSFENCLNLSPVFIDRKNKEFKLHDGYKCYELYAGKVRGNILGKEVISPYSEYEKLICALYFGGAYLVWDDFDPEDIYYPNDY
ncbi:ATP-binding protein [Acinetobacter sp. NIPH1876]|uniref:AAA family ATPase n=1 Tax=Acinetobacter sp. NIPH1876 TaxID=2924041 RepID=UPI001FAD5E4C|nr:AAA family ATPase [Acinetobacter sp. NIPH1876]MCJ0827925.1 ATP-binding protein [Acinetobacter sp. NIPH1876]